MLLKAFSANLRGSILICSPFRCGPNQITSIVGSKLLKQSPNVTTVSFRSAGKYSTENAAPNVAKQSSSQSTAFVSNRNKSELSQHEIESLNQDPDKFGTLSSYKPSIVNDVENDRPAIESADRSGTSSAAQTATKEQTMQQYEATMKDLLEKGCVLEAIDVFETEVLQKNRMHAPVRIYKWLIEECVRLHEFRKAIEIYDQMLGRKLKVPFDVFEKLVLAFEQSNMNVGKLSNIHKVMVKNHIQMNADMYNAMVRTYARSTQWITALKLADEMKSNGIPYELDTVNALMECFGYDKENGFYRFIEIWHDMHGFNLTPNVDTFNALLKCVKKCELKNVEKLKQMLETIRMQCTTYPNESEIEDGRPNLLQDPPCIGYLLPLEQVERPEQRLLLLGGLTNILHELRKYDIKPTLETVIGLLEVVPNTFVAHQKVIGLLSKHHIKPDLQIFNILLTKNCETQNFKNAMDIIDMMQSADIEVDLVSYGLLALSCSTERDAQEFIKLLQSKNLTLDVDILNAMLKNACASKNNDFVISILRAMKSHQIEPTEESIRLVDDYHAREFLNLRSYRTVSKKMRNEIFKLSRECRQWKKHFRKDESRDSIKSIRRSEQKKHHKNPKIADELQSNEESSNV